MTAADLLERLGPLVAPALEANFRKRNLCILATRTVIEVGAYFGIDVSPLPVRAAVFPTRFQERLAAGGYTPDDVWKWSAEEGFHSVGLGFGPEDINQFTRSLVLERGKDGRLNGWSGHLVAFADGLFGDFSINQAERKGLVTGPAIIGPAGGRRWAAFNDETTVEYCRTNDQAFRNAPDWKSRYPKLVGALIRKVRD